MTLAAATFPLVPRRRLVGLAFGAMHSARRGLGSDVAGSRPYTLGDDIHEIDWGASARLSSARGSDEFVVRERFAEEAPRVVCVCDRRPEMALYPRPWLDKAAAVREAVGLVADSAVRARGFFGYLDLGDGEPFWHPPRSQTHLAELREGRLARPTFAAPPDWLEQALAFLARARRSLPAGSFVFVVSDFLQPPAEELWRAALEQRWDLVPVVVQDPVWEASFPPLGPLALPVRAGGRFATLRLSAGEARERRDAHERRREDLICLFDALGLEPVRLGSADPEDVLRAFLEWSAARLETRRRRW